MGAELIEMSILHTYTQVLHSPRKWTFSVCNVHTATQIYRTSPTNRVVNFAAHRHIPTRLNLMVIFSRYCPILSQSRNPRKILYDRQMNLLARGFKGDRGFFPM